MRRPVGARREAERAARLPPDVTSLPRPSWLLAKPIALLMRNHRPFYGSPLKVSTLQGRLAKSILSNPDVFPPASVLAKLEPNRVSPRGNALRNRIWTEFMAK